ncbi:MAG: anaerobic ribonucleoside-triphosphate reductase [Desulfovibrio sp.]|uniref:anaerobic ribonucleoside-triphosphate reductase n=1 Tax=Desulfovibrio sp. TaxID=885 RepID=UPI002A36CDA6|nr:anaerobic ribonucleoside-triphosphate reductase [Desulfovibrio sp.]MDY0258489.1 anaerobic ribonucleoside-triphosphate reductase [Desulfovibrio sp.]
MFDYEYPAPVVVEAEPRPVRLVGVGVKFERTRRITGYLVGTLDRFNDAKRAEERDRVKHGLGREEV